MSGYCLSTHGGSGYASGSYWDGTAIICGLCRARIENPTPTGGRWVDEKGWRGRLLGQGHWEPKFPTWIAKEKPRNASS